MDDCIICYCPLDPNNYAFINNDAERRACHPRCLQAWLTKSNNGILTQYKITSYLLFNNGDMRTVQLVPEETPGDPDIVLEVMPDEIPLQPRDYRDCYCGCTIRAVTIALGFLGFVFYCMYRWAIE